MPIIPPRKLCGSEGEIPHGAATAGAQRATVSTRGTEYCRDASARGVILWSKLLARARASRVPRTDEVMKMNGRRGDGIAGWSSAALQRSRPSIIGRAYLRRGRGVHRDVRVCRRRSGSGNMADPDVVVESATQQQPVERRLHGGSRTVYFNGKFVPEHEARVSIFDEALMYGSMAFEMTRTYNGKPFCLREHLVRLYASLKMMQIDPGMTIDEMEALTLEVLESNKPTEGADVDWQIMHDVSRGTMGL